MHCHAVAFLFLQCHQVSVLHTSVFCAVESKNLARSQGIAKHIESSKASKKKKQEDVEEDESNNNNNNNSEGKAPAAVGSAFSPAIIATYAYLVTHSKYPYFAMLFFFLFSQPLMFLWFFCFPTAVHRVFRSNIYTLSKNQNPLPQFTLAEWPKWVMCASFVQSKELIPKTGVGSSSLSTHLHVLGGKIFILCTVAHFVLIAYQLFSLFCRAQYYHKCW